MIGRLRGEIVDKGPGYVVVDVAGVGYQVELGVRQLDAAVQQDGEVVFMISTQVREDDIRLFGFQDKYDRDAFEVLLSVSGVGPKAAIALLGTLSLRELAQAVEHENISVISSAPGIGPKTARRVSLELKGKLPMAFDVAHSGPVSPSSPVGDPLPLALSQLGYRKTEIDRALAGLADRKLLQASLEERLSASLKILSGGVG